MARISFLIFIIFLGILLVGVKAKEDCRADLPRKQNVQSLSENKGILQRTSSRNLPAATSTENNLLNSAKANGPEYFAAVVGGEDYDSTENIFPTRDGGYVITGFSWTHSLANPWNFWVIKMDRFGQVEWQRTYGKEDDSSENERKIKTSQYGYTVRWGGKAVVQTKDGGYLVAGPIHYFGAGGADVWLVKLDKEGNIDWQYTIGGADYEWVHWMEPTVDGGFILVGLTESFGKGGKDLWLIKLNDLVEVEWQKAYQTTGNISLVKLHQTEDGGFIGVGNISPRMEYQPDFLVMKFTSLGEVEWARRYGGGVSTSM